MLVLSGYAIVTETARPLIEREEKKGSDVLPWKNPRKFQRVVARIQFWKEFSAFIRRPNIIFLDRGLVDGCGYCAVEEVPIPLIVRWFGRKRYTKVFYLERLPYINDEHRKEDPVLAAKIHHEILKAYAAFGYEVVAVPVMPPEDRANFILSHVSGDRV